MAKFRTNNTSITVYGWAKQVNLKEIDSLEWLLDCKLNYLQALARRINNDNNGEVLNGATLGKSISKCCKRKLANAIWEFLNLKRQSPRCGYIENDECGNNRIISEIPANSAIAWTVNIGFNPVRINGKIKTAKEQARELQKYLHNNCYCSASLIRPAKRCKGFKLELKVWLLNSKVFEAIVKKENIRIKSQHQAEIKNWYEELQQIAEQFKLSILNPDYLSRSAQLILNINHTKLGAVGQGMTGYWYNTRPSSAVSRNMPASSLSDAVVKLMAC